jgi:hypothetical protein
MRNELQLHQQSKFIKETRGLMKKSLKIQSAKAFLSPPRAESLKIDLEFTRNVLDIFMES